MDSVRGMADSGSGFLLLPNAMIMMSRIELY